MVEVNDHFDNVTGYAYDCRNRLRNVTDPEGHKTEYIYDVANRLIETVYPIGTRILREYDAANRLLEIANIRSDDIIISSFAYEHMPTVDGLIWMKPEPEKRITTMTTKVG